MMKIQKLNLTQEWDKTFKQSDKVNHRKITFINRYGITLAADLYEPKNVTGKLPAIAISGPFGAVKEQCSGLYAQAMAENGFLTIAFDPSFTGESDGTPRYMASPDINTEDLPFFVKDYSEYYKGRAYHERSLNSNEGWNTVGCMSFMNQPILTYTNEIRSAVLMIHGEKAHSCYFSRDAYENMTKNSPYTGNKELMIIPNAVHTDLYDNTDVIPFEKIVEFFQNNM